MIKDRTYKLIVIGLVIIFAASLFFSIRFLKTQISSATHPLEISQVSGGLDINAWEKIKHRFTP